MIDLCEKCHQKPWVAHNCTDLSKPTEAWCEDCIQAEIDAGRYIAVLGDYFSQKKQKEVMMLLGRLEDEPSNIPTVTAIRKLLTEMWGE